MEKGDIFWQTGAIGSHIFTESYISSGIQSSNPIAYIHQILPHDHLQVSSAVYLVHQLVLHQQATGCREDWGNTFLGRHYWRFLRDVLLGCQL
jgi:hypothetical protein